MAKHRQTVEFWRRVRDPSLQNPPSLLRALGWMSILDKRFPCLSDSSC